MGWLDDRRGIKSSVYLDEGPVDRTNLSDAQVFLNSCKTRIRGSPWTRGRQARVRRYPFRFNLSQVASQRGFGILFQRAGRARWF